MAINNFLAHFTDPNYEFEAYSYIFSCNLHMCLEQNRQMIYNDYNYE